MKRVLVSGYFDPIHSGHMSYLREAKKLGDYLIVVIDGDDRTKAKKGKPFLPAKVRRDIIKEFKFVDKVYIENDNVKRALKKFKPDIFAKGWDRKSRETIPEWDFCHQMGIEIRTGVGQTVKTKSSDYLREWVDFYIEEHPEVIYDHPNLVTFYRKSKLRQ
jgi:D-beta-D-heptose 7-phosphate kinase/D-beta-D-heptose 1-phosphate adenosyltransferase